MDLRRTTTLRFAALAALLAALPWAATPAAHGAGAGLTSPAVPSASASAAPAPAPAPASDMPRRGQTRSFFWMNAMRSNLDWRARVTAADRMRTDVIHMREDHTDLGVLAEVTAEQRRDFRRLGGATWAMVTGHNALDNIVVYRRTAFAQVARESLTTRYEHGQRIHVTIPVLQDRATGTKVAVIAVHNPQWHSGPWRDVSLRLEAAKVTELRRRHPDWQIVVAGDFNADASPVCALSHVRLVSATGRHCGARLPIDQMFASRGLHVHGYRKVHTSATDHRYDYRAKLVF